VSSQISGRSGRDTETRPSILFWVYLSMPVTSKQIDELELFFSKAKLPTTIQLDSGSNITDVKQFVASHLNVLRNNDDKPMYDVFYSRLLRLKELIG